MSSGSAEKLQLVSPPPFSGRDEVGEQFLYPSEFLQFVTCEDVPLVWRRVIALAVYLVPTRR
ncbi:MAG TPA: hypothetical protein VI197_24550 [Polyangiaceae bacterium]